MAFSEYNYKSKAELIEYIQALEVLAVTAFPNPVIKFIIASAPDIPLNSKIDLIKTIAKIKKNSFIIKNVWIQFLFKELNCSSYLKCN